MRVVAAYLLAVLGGNESPKAADINKILSSVGVEAEAGRVDALLKELDGKDIAEIIAEGEKKLASVGGGGGSGGGGGGGGGGDGGAAAAAPEPEPEPEEEEDMGFDLFD